MLEAGLVEASGCDAVGQQPAALAVVEAEAEVYGLHELPQVWPLVTTHT